MKNKWFQSTINLPIMHPNTIHYAGKPIAQASKALVLLHGRNASATEMLMLESQLEIPDFALIAPEAYNNSWYPLSFLAPTEQNEPWLKSGCTMLRNLETELNQKGIASRDIYFFGFSQGACLCLEYTTRNAKGYGGIAAFIGGLIGENINTGNYISDFDGTPILLVTSHPDKHVPLARVRKTQEILQRKNARVDLQIFENGGHQILPEALVLVRQLLNATGNM